MQAFAADSFVNSIGVVIHMTYTDTPYYTQWPTILSDLQTLGVRHVRDGFYNWPPGEPFVQEHQQLAASGIGTNYVIPYNLSTTPAQVAALAPQVGDMESVEAPNECDVAGNCGAGTSASQSISNLLSFMPTVDASGQQANVPVLGPSWTLVPTYPTVGNIASQMTYNNLHVYFAGHNPGSPGWGTPDAEGNPYGSLQFWLDQAQIDGPGDPVMITETGYVMQPQPQTDCIPPSIGASYMPRTLLLAYMAGVQRTYMYELIDEVSSPGYGLMDQNLNPKPAYLAVQNLISTLSDKGANFTPGSLNYSLTGGDSTLKQILFQKQDGSFWLAVWLEQSSYDPNALVLTPVVPQVVNLSLDSGESVSQVGTIDDTGNLSWTTPTATGAGVPVTVSDSVTLIHIVPSSN